MEKIAGSPYIEVSFNKSGQLLGTAPDRVADTLKDPSITDLVVLSHGWKFEGEEPRQLYNAVWPQVATKLNQPPSSVLVIGVSWPSKRYSEGIDARSLRVAADGVTLSVEPGTPETDLEDVQLEQALAEALDGLEPEDAEALRATVAAYLKSKQTKEARDLVQIAASSVHLNTDDPELSSSGEALAAVTDGIAFGQVLADLADPPELTVTEEVAQTLGLMDNLQQAFSGPRAAVIRLLEQLSYYEMKDRAGIVGRSLGSSLSKYTPPNKVRLHFVGHSFGARLVTAAAHVFSGAANLPLHSVTLLQGAFSHNGLSTARGGAFQTLVGKPAGPIVISHTHNDRACTLLYAIASRLSRDVTAAIVGKNDKFGSMGANGAQFDAAEPQADDGGTGTVFTPRRRVITNYRADTYIKEHNDIRNPDVGALVASAINLRP